MNIILEKIVKITHLLLVIIFIIGPFLPGKYLIYYLFLWPAVYFHWYFNDDMCMLTEIGYNIDSNFYNSISEYYYYSNNSIFSLIKIINRYFTNSDTSIDTLNNLRSILWIFAFIRALIYYRKDIAKNWSIVSKHFISRFICYSCK